MVLGYPIVELSSSLIKTTRFLLKNKKITIQIHVTKPSELNLNRWICNLRVFDSKLNRTYRGTGGSKQLTFSFLKAFGEVCETIAMYENNFSSRCGMAAGILTENTILRAKSELIERDAFIYHYRNRLPFLSKNPIGNDLHSFELASADNNFPTYFVTNTATTLGNADCLQFGCGTSYKNATDAIQKASQEFININLNHLNFPNQCSEWSNHSEKIPTIMDFHHVKSRDRRNIDIFNSLFKVNFHTRDQIDHSKWLVTEVPSPSIFFKVFKVTHPELQKLDFGIPEPNSNDLFHPFW